MCGLPGSQYSLLLPYFTIRVPLKKFLSEIGYLSFEQQTER